MVVEALAGLVRKASELVEYIGFSFLGQCCVGLLQFANDTIFIREWNWKNLWAIKPILHGFEIVPGLQVNFHKSRVIRINLNSYFFIVTANFLSCRIEDKMFSFLGIPIGYNPRRVSTWIPLLAKYRARLSCRKGRILSIVGRVTLIKFVLGSLSIFTMAFFKAPIFVWKEIESIRNRFLWSGMEDIKKIYWVIWADVCEPFSEDGL